ncbi:N-acetylglucosamine kinase [Nakamurella endophytica]|uniref:ATPase n=1 Tax=Nakamurella endophytica TaxID=1748367 RepID=A0A917WFC4_9ACTN|nr:BadF/BadG/BcrA/BcrD ATPase family protein [Nakamurella endophytica]GGL98450.1 ATPase [Nakamurella endophytica]
MTGLLVGIDVGGTKTHLRAQSTTGRITADLVTPTTGWHAATWSTRADLLVDWVGSAVGGAAVAAVAVGARGCDTEEQARDLGDAFAPRVSVPVVVVNDAQLLGPALDRDGSICLIAGTGSIAVGQGPDGRPLFAGGHGWLVGDDGGGTGLVREAVRGLLQSQDHGDRDEILFRYLCAAAGVDDSQDLATALASRPLAEWSGWAAALFRAAGDGSPVAGRTVAAGARSLAELVRALVRRGAESRSVVMGGGVVTAQPSYAALVADRIRGTVGAVEVLVLEEPPVAGAVRLAGQLAGTTAPVAAGPAPSADSPTAPLRQPSVPSSPKGTS